jgi:hypothetical protein
VTTLRERLAQMHAEATYGTPYGKVDARVAAALVAVADAVEALTDCPLCGFPGGHHYRGYGLSECDESSCPMHKLAAALGVSR